MTEYISAHLSTNSSSKPIQTSKNINKITTISNLDECACFNSSDKILYRSLIISNLLFKTCILCVRSKNFRDIA